MIAFGIIVVALFINFNYQFNLFWKLLLGGALVWGGGRLAATKIATVSLWGKILSWLGGLVIVIALLNSGVRTFSEKSVTWIDNTLGGISAEEDKKGKPVATTIEEVYVQFKDVRPGEEVKVIVGLNTLIRITVPSISEKSPLWICPKVVWPEELTFTPELELVSKTRHEAIRKMTAPTQAKLLKQGITSLHYTFTLTPAPGNVNPCSLHKEDTSQLGN
jgi:hypothetical protein